MARIGSLLFVGLIMTTVGLVKSQIAFQNESLHAAEETTSSSRLFENVFISMVECVRQKIKDGIPALRIKTLDPYQARIPFFLPFFRNQFVRGTLLLRKLRLEGLAGFELTDGTVNIARVVKFGLNFNKIKLTSKYKAKLTVFGFMNIYGKGTLSITLNNFDVKAQVKVKTIPPLRLDNLFLNITLPSTHAVITGLLDNEFMSDLISQQLTDTLTTLAEEEHARFNAILYTAATFLIDSKINPALADLSLSELMDLLKSMAGNCDTSLANIFQTALPLIMDASGIDTDLVYSSDYSQFEEDDF